MITNITNLQKPKPTHKHIAGMMPNDNNIEFVGIPATQEVIWYQLGNSHTFKNLQPKNFELVANAYMSDAEAMADIKKESQSFRRQVEIYTYHMYGAADFTPDIKDGILQPSENFRHTKAHHYTKWLSKNITINETHLNTRQIIICDMMLLDFPDKRIAAELNIAESTLPHHKRRLYEIAEAQTKAQFVMVLKDERI